MPTLMTPTEPCSELLQQLETDLAQTFNRSHCVLTGSGTTALYTIFTALDLPVGSRIMFPDITCETAINAAIYAGYEPIFCDIDLRTFNLDWHKAADMAASEDVKVIVPTHMFGNIFDFSVLAAAVADRDVFLLEDAAQGYGGQLPGLQVGQLGDASIISFGMGKLLDCGGGGAVLTDSETMATRCRQIIDGLPSDAKTAEATRAKFMKEMFMQAKSKAGVTETNVAIHRIKRRHRNGFLSRISTRASENLAERLPGFRRRAAQRRVITGQLAATLQEYGDLQLQQMTDQSVQWRFSFLLDHDSRRMYDQLNQRGVEVSRLFSPLHREYGLPDNDFPASVHFHERVLNLKLDVPDFSVTHVTDCIKDIYDGTNI